MKKKLLVAYCLLVVLTKTTIALSQTFSSGSFGMSIPANGQPINSTINVSGLSSLSTSFGIESLCLDISHTYVGQIIVYLIPPDGKFIEITTNNGYTGKNYTGTCFKMTANKFVNSGFLQAPFTGDYRPEGDLSKINNGQNPNGIWKLAVSDDINDGNTGTLNSWSITFSNTPAVPFDFTSSNLPVMIINTNSNIASDVKIEGGMSIIYNGVGNRNNVTDARNHYDGKIGIEYRGSSSLLFPKKSYSFETRNSLGNNMDVALLGMPPECDWVLDASFPDKTQMRNTLTYRLFTGMGHYASRSRYVELMLNGQYQGIYSLTEKVKRGRGRVNISKLTETDVDGVNLTGGYIIKIDRLKGGEVGWSSNYKSNNTGDSAVFFQYYYPKADSIHPDQKGYIRDYINEFEQVLMSPGFADPNIGYRKYINVPSFIDYFLITEASKNVDGYRLSQYIHKDKDDKLVCGPVWDYDISWGNASVNEGNIAASWRYQGMAAEYFSPVWWKRFMKDPLFVDELSCRYKQLRANVLNANAVNSFIDSNVVYLGEAQQRNFKQWPILGENVWINPAPVPSTYAEEVAALKNWVSARLSWMDANMQGACAVGIAETNALRPTLVYPNPFNTSLAFSYEVVNTQRVRAELVNTLGVSVVEIFEGTESTGKYQRSINTEKLVAGIYILKLTIGDGVLQSKVIKM